MCATCSLLGTPILSVVVWNQLCTTCCRWWYPFCCVANKERSPRKDIWKAEPPVKRLCLPSSVGALARLPKHNNGPRCLWPCTVPACSQLGDTRAASTWPSGSHHQASQTTYHPWLQATQAPRTLPPACSLFSWVKNYGPQFDHTLGDSRRIPGRGNYVFEF